MWYFFFHSNILLNVNIRNEIKILVSFKHVVVLDDWDVALLSICDICCFSFGHVFFNLFPHAKRIALAKYHKML